MAEPKERNEVPEALKWDLSSLFQNSDAWEEAFRQIDAFLPQLEALKGHLQDSPENLARCLELDTEISRKMDNLYTYSHLKNDEDTRDSTFQGMHDRARTKYVEISAFSAWIRPEIIAIPEDTMQQLYNSPLLTPWRRLLDVLLRSRPHTLSPKEEEILANAEDPLATPFKTFNLLTDADLVLEKIRNEEGKEIQLTHGNYVHFLESRNREVRKNAFEAIYRAQISHKNTFAALLSGELKKQSFFAKTRNYESCLKMALFGDQIPQEVYDSLITAVHDALPALHKYFRLRQQVLALPQLDMFDLYVPIVPNFEMQVDYDTAREWVLQAISPLGEEYRAIAERGLRAERWIDVMDTKGKRSQQYSSGTYDSFPYINLNFQNNLDSVFTLAHELGHSMHSFLSNKNQPPQYASYSMFIAEIASTVNEGLLNNFLMNKARQEQNTPLLTYLLNHRCNEFKGTVYRQTQFAEFEKRIYCMTEEGAPLTADKLAEVYNEINRLYYGEAQGTTGIHASPQIAFEWSRIPHFFLHFYVFKYATSFSAAEVFVRRILGGNPRDVEVYLTLLKSGASEDPLILLRNAELDLSQPQVIVDALTTFSTEVDQLSALLVPNQ